MDIPEFKFVLTTDDKIFLPTRSEPSATGWDVRSTVDIELKPFDRATLKLGFKVFAPEGWWLKLNPRSSTFAKKHLHCLYGVIDCHYENEVMLACQYIPKPDNGNNLIISRGDRIGQIIPVRLQEMKVTEVNEEEFERLCRERQAVRQGGFGSSGDK